PTNIVLRAFAQDREDSVLNLRVEFFEGSRSLGVGTFIGSLCPAPYCPYYTLTWSNVPPGNYTLTARATDRSGVSSTSAPVRIAVGSSQAPPTPSGRELHVVGVNGGAGATSTYQR